jgi:hypothetical protein
MQSPSTPTQGDDHDKASRPNPRPTDAANRARSPVHRTLETRNSDHLDFHDVSVWGVKSALMAAYEAGRQAAKQG